MTDLLTDCVRPILRRTPASTPPEELLEQLLQAFPNEAPPRRRRRRRPLVLAGGVIAGAIRAAASLSSHGSAPGPDLAAQAYAQTDDTTGILHVRTHVESTTVYGGKTDRSAWSTELWQRGDRAHEHTLFGDAWSDMVLRADGTVRFRNADGQDVVSSDAGGPDAQSWHQRLGSDFVAEFRRDYDKGVLDASGTTVFNGRRAQRYVVDGHGTTAAEPAHHFPQTAWTEHDEYFVAVDDGTPLGAVRSSTSTPQGGATSTSRSTETVDAIEQLPVTPSNLDLLGD